MVDGEPQPASEYEGASAALEFALWRLDEQLQAIKSIDAKSERAVTIAAALLALLAGAGTFQLSSSGERHIWLAVIVALSSFFIILVVGFFFRTQETTNLHLGPDGEELLEVAAAHPEARVRQWLAENVFVAIEYNERQIEAKDRRYKVLALVVLGWAVLTSWVLVAFALV